MFELSELERLIYKLESDSDFGREIKYRKILIGTLKELHEMIGNHEIKRDIARQITHLIKMNEDSQGKMPMLNTLIYGNPGVGKTQIGIKLAKIWFALGLIKQTPVKTGIDSFNLGSMSQDDIMNYAIVVMIIAYVIMIFKAIVDVVGLANFIVALCVLIVLAYYLMRESTRKDEIIDEYVPENKIITIAGRTDFVSKYVGGSDKQTKSFLTANLGKVVFIDEGHTLIQGIYDQYGREALAEINRFLSEHEGEIVVIMAGYEKEMKAGPFEVEPGLARRFMWHFNCEGYTNEELYRIFEKQMTEGGWKIGDFKRILKLFERKIHLFPSSGGDTQRLGYFCELIHMSREDNKDKILDYSIVKEGMRELGRNNIKQEKEEVQDNTMTQLLSLLK